MGAADDASVGASIGADEAVGAVDEDGAANGGTSIDADALADVLILGASDDASGGRISVGGIGGAEETARSGIVIDSEAATGSATDPDVSSEDVDDVGTVTSVLPVAVIPMLGSEDGEGTGVVTVSARTMTMPSTICTLAGSYRYCDATLKSHVASNASEWPGNRPIPAVPRRIHASQATTVAASAESDTIRRSR